MVQNEKDKIKKTAWIKFLVRYNKMLTLLLVVLIVSLSYFLVIAPKYESISIGGQYDLDALIQKREQQQQYLAQLKLLNENYQRISQGDASKLDKVLPSQKDIPGLFIQLQALAAENNFRLIAVNIDEEADQAIDENKIAGIKRLNISLNLVGGNYLSLKQFLEDVESNLRIFDVNAVYFSPDSENYSVNLFTYYFE